MACCTAQVARAHNRTQNTPPKWRKKRWTSRQLRVCAAKQSFFINNSGQKWPTSFAEATYHGIEDHVYSMWGNIRPKVSKELYDLLGSWWPGESSQLHAVPVTATDHNFILVHPAAHHVEAQEVDEVVLLGHWAGARQDLQHPQTDSMPILTNPISMFCFGTHSTDTANCTVLWTVWLRS